MRKPIGVASLQRGTAETVVVICDDGTAWRYKLGGGTWDDLAAIPGTAAAPSPPKVDLDAAEDN